MFGTGVGTPAEALAEWAAAAPGPDVMRALTGFDPAGLDASGQVLLLQAWERQAAWVQAAQQEVIVAVGGPPGAEDWGREEVAAALRLSASTADRRLQVARALSGRLAATGAALRSGDLSYRHAAVLADAVEELSDPVARAVEDRVLAKAGPQTVAEFRRTVQRAVLVADPLGGEVRHAQARAGREVTAYSDADGMGAVVATLDAEGVAVVMTAVDARAGRQGATDDRGIGARRADALVEICRDALAGADLPPGQGQIPTAVNLTIDVATLLGLADHPGELALYGPIPAGLARRLAERGQWRRLVTDPLTGALLDRAPRTYQPGRALADYVRARDQVCCFPGCRQPARRADLDHAVAFDDGGDTTRTNLGALCRRHHRLKHETGWQLERHPDESATWTSPAGQRYHVRPPSYHADG